MKTLTTFFGILLVLALIVAIGYGMVSAVEYIRMLYMTLESATRIVLISVLVVVCFGSFVIANAIKSAGSKHNKSAILQAKLKLYEAIMNAYQSESGEIIGEDIRVNQKTLEVLQTMDTPIQLVASAQIINLNRQLKCALEEQLPTQRVQSLYTKLIEAMRTDLGVAGGFEESSLEFLVPQRQKSEAHSPQPST